MNKPTKPLAVLIVEDLESDAQLLVHLLKKAGYELVYEQVETAEQMRVMLEKRLWDIIISDYKLPQFDGRAALQLVQEMGRETPFIIVSGTIGEETAVAMMKAGAHDYLVKGDLARLVPAVERELEQSAIRRERRYAEDALRESEERYRSLFDRMLDGVYRSTHAGRFVDVNPAMVRMFGYSSREEMLEMDIKSELYFDPEERGTHVLDTGQGETDIYRLRRKDGSEIWVEDRGNYTHDEQGRIIFHEGMMRDVTERMQVKDALAASEAELRALFASMQDVVLVIDRQGVYRKIAPTNPVLLVKPPEELLGNNLRDVFPAEQAETFIGAVQQVLDTKQTAQIEYELLIGNRTVWFETSISPMDKDSTLWVARDVTERVRAEEALRASEERFHSLYDNATIGLYRTTPGGRILMLNPAGVRMLGYGSFDEIAQRDLENLEYQTDSPRKDFREILDREGAIFGLERKMIKKDGSIIFVRESAKVFRNENGQVLYYDGSFEDITERKRAEQNIHQRVTELEVLYESGLALSQLLDPKEIGLKILELMKEKLGWHHTVIRLYHPLDDSLELLAFNQPGLESETDERAVEEGFNRLISRSGDGLSGWAVQQSQIVRSGDVRNNPHYIETYPGIRSGLYTPMKLGESVIGVISIESEQPDAFSEADERLISTLANQAASAFENARLFKVTRQRVMELETLNRISLVLRAVSQQAEMLSIVLDEALAILNTSHGSIELWDEVGGNLQKTITRGWLAEVTELPQNSDEGISGRVLTSGEIYISREFAGDAMARVESRNQIPPGWGGVCLPIRTTSQTLGVLTVSVPSERELNEDEIRLLTTLAEMTGSALHRMRLFDETARQAEEFASLYETSKALSAENELNTLLQSIIEHARTLLHAASSGIYLFDTEREELEVVVDTDTAYSITGMRLRLGEGAAGRVAQTRQPLRIEDYSTWEDRSQKYAGIPFRAVVEVPVLYGGELVGVLTANETGDSERKFTEADERLLSLFASQAAGAIRSARLHEETVHRLEHLQALRAVEQAIASSLDMRLTLNIILTHTLPQLGVDAADVLLLHSGSNLLEFTAGRGFRTRRLEGSSVGLSESFAGRSIMEHRIIMALDLRTAEQNPQFGKLWKEEGFSSYWCVPLIVKGEAKGALEVYRRTAFTPNPEWLEFLETLASQAAIAIENTQLFENLQRANTDLILAYNATIEGWSRAMDMRDQETEGHTRRVADLTMMIARVMGIKDQEMLRIRRGALLHDIGKMGIPDYILLKPDKLTDEEWAIMRTHPQLARDMLMPIAYLHDVLDIPYSHHEKWDGTGYPQGLKGPQIPLSARLFAIVDVWDALTSDRPYRKKWTKKKALAYIHEQRGKHFDPQVVDAFAKITK